MRDESRFGWIEAINKDFVEAKVAGKSELICRVSRDKMRVRARLPLRIRA